MLNAGTEYLLQRTLNNYIQLLNIDFYIKDTSCFYIFTYFLFGPILQHGLQPCYSKGLKDLVEKIELSTYLTIFVKRDFENIFHKEYTHLFSFNSKKTDMLFISRKYCMTFVLIKSIAQLKLSKSLQSQGFTDHRRTCQ